jgi:hypothetical protein
MDANLKSVSIRTYFNKARTRPNISTQTWVYWRVRRAGVFTIGIGS